MTEKAPKVGDVVAWADAPDGAMVRDRDGAYHLRRDGGGTCVRSSRSQQWHSWDEKVPPRERGWDWIRCEALDGERAVIVALGLTSQETAADLQRMAEVFEVREALDHLFGLTISPSQVERQAAVRALYQHSTRGLHGLAERLHALGWRKGQTAEDAARLLREAGR